MGNSKSTQQNSEIINVNHPYFGDIHVVEHEKQKYMKIKMLIQGEKVIDEWKQIQQIIKDINQQSLLLPSDYKFQKAGMCGTTGILNILYENHPVILKDQIQNRRQTQQQFEETQIWYLLHILIESATQFHKRNHKVGDIRPDNIFVNEQGQIKLANICSWPREQRNYSKSFNDKQQTYLSPQQLSQLLNNIPFPVSDPIKGQSFSIGLTLLDAICLQDSSKFYNFKNYTFDKNKLYFELSKLQSKNYSDFLKQIVNELLIIDPNLRKSPKQIYNKILPYEYNIKNLIPFSHIVNLPYGSRNIISTAYDNRQPEYGIHNTKNYNFTQSIYENKKTFPSPGISVPNNIIPNSTFINQYPSDISQLYKQNYPQYSSTINRFPNQNFTSIPKLSGVQGTKSKQQLWQQIDQQIQKSKKLFQ